LSSKPLHSITAGRDSLEFAPKGHHSIAQGNALGQFNNQNSALKGRRSALATAPLYRPFRARKALGTVYPGRCPGLCCAGPSGRKQTGTTVNR